MTDRVTVSATMVQVDLDGDWDSSSSHDAGQDLVITLSKLTASPKRGDHEFTTSSRARGGTFERLAAVDADDDAATAAVYEDLVTVGNILDGMGSVAIEPSSVYVGETVTFEITFTAAGSMHAVDENVASQVIIQFPTGFDLSGTDPSDTEYSVTGKSHRVVLRDSNTETAGNQFVTISGDNTTVTLHLETIEKDEKVEITFEDVVVPPVPNPNYIDVDTNTRGTSTSIFTARCFS